MMTRGSHVTALVLGQGFCPSLSVSAFTWLFVGVFRRFAVSLAMGGAASLEQMDERLTELVSTESPNPNALQKWMDAVRDRTPDLSGTVNREDKFGWTPLRRYCRRGGPIGGPKGGCGCDQRPLLNVVTDFADRLKFLRLLFKVASRCVRGAYHTTLMRGLWRASHSSQVLHDLQRIEPACVGMHGYRASH